MSPTVAQIESSDATFNEAVQAVKDRNFRHAVKLFSIQAQDNQHDAQYNLALLLETAEAHVDEKLREVIGSNPVLVEELGARALQGKAYLPGSEDDIDVESE